MKPGFRLLLVVAIAALAGCVVFPIPLPPLAMRTLPPVSPTPTASPGPSGPSPTPTPSPTATPAP
jgi:hypothetical protein